MRSPSFILPILAVLLISTPVATAFALPHFEIDSLRERIQTAVPEHQRQDHYSFYLPFVVDTETLLTQLRGMEFTTPYQRRAFRLSSTGEDPILFSKPVTLIQIGDTLFPAPETDIPGHMNIIEGTKVSLVPYRVRESIPEPIMALSHQPVSDVTVRYDSTNQERPYSFAGTYQEGHEIQFTQLLSRIADRLATPEEISPIATPIIRTIPRIFTENFDQNSIIVQDLVATGSSDFSGSSADRVHNIEVSLAIYNGIVIGAGQEFSFNNLLGPVDESTGYRKELVIKGPETIPEFGGGVCQVSSTIYRAALAGGFEIVERRNHSYAVSYYEPWGSDATIYPGVVDFRFRNDSDHDLVVHAYIQDQQVVFNFYGVHDGRKTSLDGPYTYGHQAPPTSITHPVDWLAPGTQQLRQNGVTGFQAHWNRTVIMPDGEERTRTFRSSYQARPAHYYVGPQETTEEVSPEETS